MAQCAMPLLAAAALPEAFDAGSPGSECLAAGAGFIAGPVPFGPSTAIAAGRLQPMGACARVDGITPRLRLSRVFAPDGDFCGSTRPLIRSRRGVIPST